MYPLLLGVHSLLRWVVLAAGAMAFFRAASGRGRPWGPADDRPGRWFALAMDVQFLIGLALYAWVSPITRVALSDFGAAMSNSMLRFWAVEHLFGMLIAIALVHVGRVRIRKAEVSRRHRLAMIFYGLALLAVLVSIPWPGMPSERPLIRGF
jgi:hypothetical protein